MIAQRAWDALIALAGSTVFATPLNGPDAPSGMAFGVIHSASITSTGAVHSLDAVLTLSGRRDDGVGRDDFRLVVLDHSEVVTEAVISVPLGMTLSTTQSLSWSGPVGEQAPGVGVYFYAAPEVEVLGGIDPLLFPGEGIVDLSKFAPTGVEAGQSLVYSLIVATPGEVGLSGLTLRDRVPNGAHLVSATGGGASEGNVVYWLLGFLAPQETRTEQMTLVVTDDGELVRNDFYMV